jgi:hypothetical protein
LLAVRHTVYASIEFVSYAQLLEPRLDLLLCAVLGYAVFDFDILQCRKFTEEAKILKEYAYTLLAYVAPMVYIVTFNILAIKRYDTSIIAALTV